jgi:DNA/RNA-binding domain of Phe-tRNA-synthetase-like protein
VIPISATDTWRITHPGAVFGLLEISGVDNTCPSASLQDQKRTVETRLRARYQGFGRKEFLALPVMAAYERYYKRFDKTYHVLLQLESIVLKGKNLPDVSPLVDANFSAEVETQILTAGHDADCLSGEIRMDVAGAGDLITRMSGAPKLIDTGDMLMRDAAGVCCTLLYGQDNRSPITPLTTHALYVSYAPAGVPAGLVQEHLERIVKNIGLFLPVVQVEQLCLLISD